MSSAIASLEAAETTNPGGLGAGSVLELPTLPQLAPETAECQHS